MTYKGRVKNGTIVLDPPAALPEGTEVRVEPVGDEDDDYRGLRERLRSLSGIIEGLPSDMARNHDHYIHGAPKK